MINILHLKQLLLLAAGLLISGFLFAQNDLPDKPEILRVSFDTSYHGAGYRVIIEWLPSDSADVEWYRIYRDNNAGAGILIDSVPYDVTRYTYILPDLENLKYSVTAYDSKGNESLRTPGEHRAALLHVEFDTCNQQNIITWSDYEGWGDNLSVYRIYFAEGNNPFTLLRPVEPSVTHINHEFINENSTYKYLVEAVKNQDNLISHSNIAVINTIVPDPPSFIYIDYVDVVDNANIKLSISADLSGQIRDFQLLRSTSQGNGFQIKETFRNYNQNPIIKMDQAATSASQYFYRVDAIYQPNGCPKSRVVQSSAIGSTILLFGDEDNYEVSLFWTPFEDHPGSVLEGYAITREIVGNEPVEIVQLSSDTRQFSEDISEIVNGPQSGKVIYRVKAIFTVISNGERYESRSNAVAIELTTSLQMPNAFTPNGDGMNDDFKPVLDFAPESFLMIIYDRNGGKLFQTTDPYQGWDGSSRGGEPVMEGVYVYHIQYTDFTGLTKTLSGNVTVVYP